MQETIETKLTTDDGTTSTQTLNYAYDASGTAVVTYTYDAWGNILETLGTMASTLGKTNALTYRGYVYDNETELYYLQSRYYNPERGRFLNADALVATGHGTAGNNMFAYCGNNPVSFSDPHGTCEHDVLMFGLIDCPKCRDTDSQGTLETWIQIIYDYHAAQREAEIEEFGRKVQTAQDLINGAQAIHAENEALNREMERQQALLLNTTVADRFSTGHKTINTLGVIKLFVVGIDLMVSGGTAGAVCAFAIDAVIIGISIAIEE